MDTYDKTTPRRRRRLPKAVATGLGLLGLGATAGAVASTAVSANAATTTTAAPASSSTTAPSGASTTAPSGASTTAPSGASTTGPSGASSMAPPRGGAGLPLSGTVTAVGSSDVTIETSAATTTYAVTSTSDIDKNGEATLSDLAVGDAVTFSTVTSNGTTAIERLHAGNAQLDTPSPGPGGGAGLPLSGTVTAVGSSDVTIQTSAATTTYAVTSTSDIDKNGEATLSDLAVGDAVTFSTVPSNGTTAIDRLHAGNEQLDMPGPGATPTGGPAAATSGSTSSA